MIGYRGYYKASGIEILCRKGDLTMDRKLEELLSTAKLNELLHRKQAEEKKESNPLVWALAIIGAVAAVAAIAYAVYYFFVPDYLEDFEDDFEDEYEDDFIDEETGSDASKEASDEEASTDAEDEADKTAAEE